ncbi:stalk domain-containing protein [Paenibacillus marinisediminis]
MFKRRYVYICVTTLIITLFIGLLLPQETSAAQATQSQRTVIMLDGYPLEFAAEPIITNGYTMVPFRGIAEAMNISVQWNQELQTITATHKTKQGSKNVILQLNKKTAIVDGQQVELAIAPFSKAGTSYIPLSFFSTQFGAQVNWDQSTKTVSIQSPPQEMYSAAFYAISSFKERDLISQFDMVAFGWARLTEEGTLTTEGRDFYWPPAAGDITPEVIVNEAEQGGTSPYLMVFAGDVKGELTKMLEDEELRAAAIKNIIQLARDNHFAGIVLDFEGLGLSGDKTKAKKDYNDFVKLLSEQAKAADLKLTLVLHPLNGAYQGYDYKTLATLADDLIIMAYAYEGEHAPEPLAKVNEAIKLALKEVPKDKLLLGISMGSENAQSIQAKIGLAKRYQLKGTAVWRLGQIGDEAMKQIENSIIPLKS